MIRTKWLMYAPEGAGTAVSGGDAGAVQESPGVPGRTQSPAPEAEAEPSAAGGPAAPPGEAAAPAAQDAEEGRNEALPQETEADNAREVADKYWRQMSELEASKRRERGLRRLMSRGFSAEASLAAIRQVEEEEQ